MTEVNPVTFGTNRHPETKTKAGFESSNMKESLFTKLDKDKDGTISQDELMEGGYSGNKFDCFRQILFFAERNVNKWFSADNNKDGKMDNVELMMWNLHNTDPTDTTGDMTNEEYAKINNIIVDNTSTFDEFKQWIIPWIEDDNFSSSLCSLAKERYGIELSQEEQQLLYDTVRVQANKWLFKTDSLYNRVNTNAISTLYNTGEPEACCGGDVCYLDLVSPPIEEYDNDGNMVRSGYTKEQMEDRFRRVSGYMTEAQAEEYKKIILDVTDGKWECSVEQFYEIVARVNGNSEDPNILTGKTKADVPPERMEWYNYLKENGLLLEQFE